VRGRRAGRLPDPDADPRHQQHREAARRAGERGHRAPDDDPEGDDRATRAGVCPARDRNSSKGVEERERDPAEKAQLGVGQ